MKYKAVSLTANKVTENFNGYSKFLVKALQSLADTAVGCPVFINFDQRKKIGEIIFAKVQDDKLLVEFETMKEIPINSQVRIVPSYIVEKHSLEDLDNENLVRNIKTAKCVSFGVVVNPVEKDLPEIEEIK